MSQNEISVIESKLDKLVEWESLAKEAQEQANSIKLEIQETMAMQGTDEIVTPKYVARFIDVLTTRFDTKRFKEKFGDEIYNAFTKQVSSKRWNLSY